MSGYGHAAGLRSHAQTPLPGERRHRSSVQAPFGAQGRPVCAIRYWTRPPRSITDRVCPSHRDGDFRLGAQMTNSGNVARNPRAVTAGHDRSVSPPLDQITAVVHLLFEAGLALDSIQQSPLSDHDTDRAADAVAALDTAVLRLRSLGASLNAF